MYIFYQNKKETPPKTKTTTKPDISENYEKPCLYLVCFQVNNGLATSVLYPSLGLLFHVCVLAVLHNVFVCIWEQFPLNPSLFITCTLNRMVREYHFRYYAFMDHDAVTLVMYENKSRLTKQKKKKEPTTPSLFPWQPFNTVD